jgi:hypothetical protein
MIKQCLCIYVSMTARVLLCVFVSQHLVMKRANNQANPSGRLLTSSASLPVLSRIDYKSVYGESIAERIAKIKAEASQDNPINQIQSLIAIKTNVAEQNHAVLDKTIPADIDALLNKAQSAEDNSTQNILWKSSNTIFSVNKNLNSKLRAHLLSTSSKSQPQAQSHSHLPRRSHPRESAQSSSQQFIFNVETNNYEYLLTSQEQRRQLAAAKKAALLRSVNTGPSRFNIKGQNSAINLKEQMVSINPALHNHYLNEENDEIKVSNELIEAEHKFQHKQRHLKREILPKLYSSQAFKAFLQRQNNTKIPHFLQEVAALPENSEDTAIQAERQLYTALSRNLQQKYVSPQPKFHQRGTSTGNRSDKSEKSAVQAALNSSMKLMPRNLNTSYKSINSTFDNNTHKEPWLNEKIDLDALFTVADPILDN